MSDQSLLTKIETAIEGLVDALADSNIQEYQLHDGRRVRRYDFSTTLDSLMRQRIHLERRTNEIPVRVGKLI